MSTTEALKQITALLQGAHEQLAHDNAAPWQRLKQTLSDAIDRWTVENVRGLVDEIVEERAEAQEEAQAQAAREREEREQFHMRKYGHYPRERT